MNLTAFLLLIPAIACYSISQLQQHGKLKWSKKGLGFWDFDSDKRKYMSKIPFAKTALVFLTDGYHLMQFFMFIFLSLSITFAAGFDWWLLAGVWTGIHLVHVGVYKLLQK